MYFSTGSILCLIILFIVFSRLKAEPQDVHELSPQVDTTAAIVLPESLGSWHKQQASETQWQPEISSSGVLQSLASYAIADVAVSVFIAQPGSHLDKISAGAVKLVGAEGWFQGGVKATQPVGSAQLSDIIWDSYLFL